jgi:very-short-patch-repair endonuclease
MTKHLARAMRRRMTDAEIRLWFHLRPMRQRGLAFRRQSTVAGYILDFECRKAKLGVEVDGSQHDQTDARSHDAEREACLAREGYIVLRFWNHDVLHATDEIVEHIMRVATERAVTLGRG